MREGRQSIKEFRKLFESALVNDDSELLESTAHKLDSCRLLRDRFPEDSFQMILDIMGQPQFVKMKGGWVLLTIFRDNREALSEQQEDRLLSAMERIYPEFIDYMGWFTICELLGREFGNRQALDTLTRFAEIDAAEPRSFIPHALEHIIRENNEQPLVRASASLLLTLRMDPSKTVRREARECIVRMARVGIKLSAILRKQEE